MLEVEGALSPRNLRIRWNDAEALVFFSGRLYKRFIKNTEDEENDPLYDEGGKHPPKFGSVHSSCQGAGKGTLGE